MRMNLDYMSDRRVALKAEVNAAFNAAAQSHVAMAHAQKRTWAETQDGRLQPEADLRGISVAELAALILSKPNDLAERELQRQRIMMNIDAAATSAELDAIKGPFV
ncbi:hypothetical protein AAFX91_21890 [Bradyrhizobium sp. 31Argb]|uniref:hypothetical protein n=1 Tax=Bradyrhizobium sp. 31Argb TaxID=3141247 RepID=UPI0037491B2F